LRERLAGVTERIEAAETRVAEIDRLFCTSDYFATTPADDIRTRQAERADVQTILDELMAEWETIEREIAELG